MLQSQQTTRSFQLKTGSLRTKEQWMRFLRFLFRELFLRGIVFAVLGTIVLSGLYLLSVGATPQESLEAFKSFFQLITGAPSAHPGFSSGQIIASGAAITLPLALMSLV